MKAPKVPNKQKLIQASEQVLKLAAERRKRMQARKGKVTAAPAPVAKPAAAKPAAAPVVAPVAAKTDAKPAAAKPAAKPAEVAAAGAVKAADSQPANGGFEAALTPVKDAAGSLGQPEFGYAVPPEIADLVEQTKDEVDETFQPGIMIPPGLEDLVTAVADPTLFPKDASVRFDLVPFGPDSKNAAEVLQAGAHWVLFANGEPCAKIALKDQANSEKVAVHFMSADYARGVIESIAKSGLGETLKSVKARTYVAFVDQHKKVTEIREKLAASSTEQLRQKTAALREKFVNNLGYVLKASAANFIVENPFKDALVASIASMGIPEATVAKAVDEAFFAKGVPTIAGYLDTAEKWSNIAPEALKEIIAAIDAAGVRTRPLPSAMSAAQRNPEFDQGLANRMAASAVPVVPASEGVSSVSASVRVGNPEPTSGDDRANFRRKFGSFAP